MTDPTHPHGPAGPRPSGPAGPRPKQPLSLVGASPVFSPDEYARLVEICRARAREAPPPGQRLTALLRFHLGPALESLGTQRNELKGIPA